MDSKIGGRKYRDVGKGGREGEAILDYDWDIFLIIL